MFLAVISAPTVIWLVLVGALAVFIVWRVRATTVQTKERQREREMRLLASLPATATLSLISDIAPKLDALVLPGDPAPPVPGDPAAAAHALTSAVEPAPQAGAAAPAGEPTVEPGRPSAGGQSLLVERAVESLMVASIVVTDAGAEGNDAAAAEALAQAISSRSIQGLLAAQQSRS